MRFARYTTSILSAMVFSAAATAQPICTENYEIARSTMATPYDAVLVGSTLYVVDTTIGLRIFDVTDPANPIILSTYPTYATHVSVHGTTAYLTVGFPGLAIIDVSDPSTPNVLEIRSTMRTYATAIEGDRLYTQRPGTGRPRGFDVYSIADPTNPVLLGGYEHPTRNYTHGFEVHNDIVYYTGQQELGLIAVDATDPASPALLSVYSPANADFRGFVIEGDTAYISDIHLGLLAVDYSNPLAPALLDAVPVATTAVEVEFQGTTAYVSDEELGVRLFDATDPGNLIDLGCYETDYFTGSLVIDGDTIYSAAFSYIFDPNSSNPFVATGGALEVLSTDCQAPCDADLNGDSVVDNGDIGSFVALYLAGDLAADFNGDGILDNGDIGSFVAAFLAGC